jgi:hypothetical protein
MAKKKHTKKLDLILAEIGKLRSEIRALASLKPAPTAKAPRKAKAPKPKAKAPLARKAAAPAKKAAAPKRPVLVAGSDAPPAQPAAARTAH